MAGKGRPVKLQQEKAGWDTPTIPRADCESASASDPVDQKVVRAHGLLPHFTGGKTEAQGPQK